VLFGGLSEKGGTVFISVEDEELVVATEPKTAVPA